MNFFQRIKNVFLSGKELTDAQLNEGARQDYTFRHPSEFPEPAEQEIVERSTGQTVFELLAGLLMVFVGGIMMFILGLPGIAYSIGVLFNINGLAKEFPLNLTLGLFFGGILLFAAAYFLIRHGIRVISGKSKR